MNTFDAIMLIECPDEDTTYEDQIEAVQSLIDSGLVWQLQGAYGRLARSLIEAGECQPATKEEDR